jgi:hypothetical protein
LAFITAGGLFAAAWRISDGFIGEYEYVHPDDKPWWQDYFNNSYLFHHTNINSEWLLRQSILVINAMVVEPVQIPRAHFSDTYTVRVLETIRGEPELAMLTVRIPSHDLYDEDYWLGKRIVAFLVPNRGWGHYDLVMEQHGLFTYDRRDRLYSYSYNTEISWFDGKRKEVLFEYVRESEVFGELPEWGRWYA